LGPNFLPRQLGRIFLREYAEPFVIYVDAVPPGGDFVGQVAKHRIVFQKMCERLRAGQIVYCDKLEIRITQGRAHYIASNTPETINTYFNCHVASEFYEDTLQ